MMQVVRDYASRSAQAASIRPRRRPKVRSVNIRQERPRDGHATATRSATRSAVPWARGGHAVGKVPARRSISRVLSRAASRRNGDGHPSGAVGRPTAHAADPRAGQRTSPPRTVARPRVAPSYLALLRVEFARFTPVGGSHRRPASSLWHWSSPHGGRALPATLRWGARTFLTPSCGVAPTHDARPSDRLAGALSLTRPRCEGSSLTGVTRATFVTRTVGACI